ncbi:MAG: SPFH domain-containing protein, partial [Kiritimatiellia bacterium]|nr:SPFH domain-containing protein [Kiritimatiellia bacterium]
ILARTGEKGIQEDVLGEGRYFRNPVTFEWKILPVVNIPPGKVGIVTAKVGEDLPEGEFLADPGQKGVWRHTLSPGKYRMNPYGYQIDIVDATSVPIGYVGVVTSLSGKQAPENAFAQSDEKGIRADILQPGLYFANPKRHRIDVVEVGVNQVSLLGREGGEVLTKNVILPQSGAIDDLQMNILTEQRARRESYMRKERSSIQIESAPQARAPTPAQKMRAPQAGKPPARMDSMSVFTLNQYVTFPSRDGFEISLDMTVEFELLPASIPTVFRSFGDLPAVVDKVIMPQILSLSRLKGSAYRATEFIVGEGRERFQDDLTVALSQILAERKIGVHGALIRHVNVPEEILQPIQQASMAKETDLTNQEKQNTARRQAELNTELSMIDQRGEQVQQETERMKAEIRAEQDRKVAQIGADTLKKAADIGRQTAEVRAEQTRTIGAAKAQVVQMVDGEKARGFQLKTKAFDDPVAFGLWEFANRFNPEARINIIHAGEGTLWTDLQKAGLGDLGGAAILKTK